MKKTVAVLLSTSFLLSFASVSLATEAPSSIVSQTLFASSGDCGDNLRWNYDGATATMTISGTGKMDDYPNYAPPWVHFRPEIQTLVVEEGVSTLGWSSFYGCSQLTEVYLPESLESLEYGAFAYCSALSSISLPPNLHTIGIAAFVACTSMTSLVVPQTVTSIEDSAFIDCFALRSISIPASLSYVGSSAFKNCNALSTVYYEGNSSQRSQIWVKNYYNSKLTGASWQYYNYTAPVLPEAPNPVPEIPDWAKLYTDFVANGIMPDISGENYDEATPRGLIAQSLYNMVGNGVPASPHSFTDVSEYDGAISWCDENNIMNGFGDGIFSPNTPVTREEFASILRQTALVFGKDTAVELSVLDGFADVGEISSWANSGMAWAVSQKLMSGSENFLLPRKSISRAEVAVMLYQFHEYVK